VPVVIRYMMDSFLEQSVPSVKTVSQKDKGQTVLNIACLIKEVEGKTGVFPLRLSFQAHPPFERIAFFSMTVVVHYGYRTACWLSESLGHAGPVCIENGQRGKP